MLNINELETRWIYYKIKSFIPHFVIVVSLIIIVLVASQYDFNKDATQNILVEKKTSMEEKLTPSRNHNEISRPKEDRDFIAEKKLSQESTQKKLVSKEEIKQSLERIIKKESNTKLFMEPSLEFMHNIEEDSPAYYSSYTEPKKIKKKKIVAKKAKMPKVLPIEVPVEEVKVKVQDIKIKRQNTQDDIQHVVKRFKSSNNPSLSLFIAKKYYELANYNQSYNYALITNDLNNDIEESWIIFVKSLYKLNKKDKAILVLKKYIDTSHSHRAKVLLDQIKTGKMQ